MHNKQNLAQSPEDKATHDIYSLYFVGWIFGFLAFIIGFVWALYRRSVSKSAMYRSHHQFQSTVAWQGVVVLLVAIGVWWLALPYLSLLHWWRAPLLVFVSIIFPIYWWFKRCIRGYRLLCRKQRIINPNTFWMPKSEFPL